MSVVNTLEYEQKGKQPRRPSVGSTVVAVLVCLPAGAIAAALAGLVAAIAHDRDFGFDVQPLCLPLLRIVRLLSTGLWLTGSNQRSLLFVLAPYTLYAAAIGIGLDRRCGRRVIFWVAVVHLAMVGTYYGLRAVLPVNAEDVYVSNGM